MKARHEFVSDKKFYDYLKIYMSVEFVKAAIINDDGDTDTICTEVVTLSNKLIEELKKDKEIGETK